MLISIITICKNAKSSIGRTIESVAAQSFDDYEYVIIDGGSTDGTIDIIRNNLSHISHYVSEPDRGISEAFNKGIDHSTGDYILFLNSGDYFVDEHVLEKAAAVICEKGTDVVTFSVTGLLSDKWPSSESEAHIQWRESLIPHQGTFVKRSLFERIGNFDDRFRIRMDYDFFKRAYYADATFSCSTMVITWYDANGISSTNRSMMEKEGLAIRLLYDKDVADSEVDVVKKLINHLGENGLSLLDMHAQDQKLIVLMREWLRVLHYGSGVRDFLRTHGYHRIAIYGYGDLGRLLEEELKNSDLEIVFIADRNGKEMREDILTIADAWPDADCLIVTPFQYYEVIQNDIMKVHGNIKMIPFDKIISELKSISILNQQAE